MRFTQSWLAVGAIVVSMALPNASWAKSALETRLERLENIIENQVNTDLLQQLDLMQQEVQELRGKIEEQNHEIAQLTQRQEKLFLNLDSRIGSLTKNAGATANSILPQEPQDHSPVSTSPADLDDDQPPPPGQIHASDGMWRSTEHNEKATYESAYKLVTAKNYKDAVPALKDYLVDYPSGTYAANAHYWIGEVYVAQWQAKRSDKALIDSAISSFQVVVKNFPKHHKAADAMLKLGIVEADLQHWDVAKGYLNKVIQQYPNTSGARIAENKLQQIQNN
jgi:tol-pal system protein YbgF